MKEYKVLLSPKNSLDMMGTLFDKGDIIQGIMVIKDGVKYIELMLDGSWHMFNIDIVRRVFYIERGSIEHE